MITVYRHPGARALNTSGMLTEVRNNLKKTH